MDNNNQSIPIINSEEEIKIVNAIKVAESNTSGEIRVHITYKDGNHSIDYAKQIFLKHKINETVDRNAVLIFISAKERTFIIIGDQGINEVVEQEFWDIIKDKTIEQFKLGNFFDGILYSLNSVAEKLNKHFPWKNNDKNELPDEISYS